jgi:parallel beta-helix repeat protein
MNTKLSWQQFKSLLLAPSLLGLLLSAPGGAAAAASIGIKDTNYPVPSGAYFVSPNGKDSNSGKTPNSPWTVNKAIKSAPTDATIVFRGGTYRNINTTITKKLTLQAYPHEKAWLKGSIEVQGWVADGSTWRKDGWNYSFPSTMGSEYIDPSYPMAGYRDMVYINDVALKQVRSKAAVVPGTFYVDSANNKLYIGNNPAGKTVEATTENRALLTWKTRSSNPSGTVIKGLGFAHYADTAINVQVPSVTLENSTFVWNGVAGVSFSGEGTNGIVRGNTFSYNGLKGLAGVRAHRILVENNTISYNNIENFSRIWDAAGVKIILTDGLIWRRNLVENNFANGMWVDVSSTNATIVNNTTRYNQGIGIFFEISHKAIIAANVAYNNGVGIMVSNSSSARVYNNTLTKNHVDLYIKETKRNNTNREEINAGITWITRNNIIKNNIFSNKNGAVLFNAPNCETNQPSTAMITAADYNGYYRTSSSQPKTVIKWSLGSGKCLLGYTSVAAFKSATSFETHALAIDNVTTNPFFINEENGDYRLKLGSPAIGRGERLPADIVSALGWSSAAPVDLGALQRP